MITTKCNQVFEKCLTDYHKSDNVDTPMKCEYSSDSFEYLLYKKCWIDVVQWHLEDIIRSPELSSENVLNIKRRIDQLNQERTNLVEYLDAYFLDKYKDVVYDKAATLNTESPAWALDRLCILAIKIYHMRIESEREDASENHKSLCKEKLNVLLTQQIDLGNAIDDLLNEIEKGKKVMKVYKQMKMYNDPSLNPILYNRKA